MIPLAITAAIQNACRRRNTGTSHSRRPLAAMLTEHHETDDVKNIMDL